MTSHSAAELTLLQAQREAGMPYPADLEAWREANAGLVREIAHGFTPSLLGVVPQARPEAEAGG
jgi:hypothetical protein